MPTRSEDQETVTHIRRCHVCGMVNELKNQAIHKCVDCGKHLAPFFYFDESSLQGLTEGSPFLSIWKASTDWRPLWGLSTYWSE